MKIHVYTTVILVTFCFCFAFSQQENDFDGQTNLPVFLDSTQSNNIWQIGRPNKTQFTNAISQPNALVTDTILSYPTNNVSSFIFKVEVGELQTFPYIQLWFYQKMDCEAGKDGRVIEMSSDSMQTWVNIFDEDPYKPMMLSDVLPVELLDGQKGFSYNDTLWHHTLFCWSDVFAPRISTIYMRFTFYSDDHDTQQDGWMIDNIKTFPSIIDASQEYQTYGQSGSKSIVYPNPFAEILNVKLDDLNVIEPCISVYDCTGSLVHRYYGEKGVSHQINTENLSSGLYELVITDQNGKLIDTHLVIKP